MLDAAARLAGMSRLFERRQSVAALADMSGLQPCIGALYSMRFQGCAELIAKEKQNMAAPCGRQTRSAENEAGRVALRADRGRKSRKLGDALTLLL